MKNLNVVKRVVNETMHMDGYAVYVSARGAVEDVFFYGYYKNALTCMKGARQAGKEAVITNCVLISTDCMD